ncbi:hypothetical protein ACQV5M_18795 [Leptospira sp. SA-E8]|uniref:hypothetical protein n=1 Tax=Leptospira sp. SA-E8 TaxID=3422259 RepID=UPI003EB697A6
MDLIQELNTYLSRKLKLFQSLTNFQFPIPVEFIVKDIGEFSLETLQILLDKTDFTNSIYRISTSKVPFALEEIIKKFQTLKNEHKEKYDNPYYHISKINKEHDWKTALLEYTIYLGSKREDIKTRLKQHLGLIDEANRGVYSLYLKDWWPIKCPLKITIWSFGENVTNDQLQIIEDCLWQSFKPLFGKSGPTFNMKNGA